MVDTKGDVYFRVGGTDTVGWFIQRVNTSGQVTTIAGNGSLRNICVASGDGKLAVEVPLCSPYDISIGSAGSIYFVDPPVVRRIADGIIETVVGCLGGTGCSAGNISKDGLPAKSAMLNGPSIVWGADGLYLADRAGTIFKIAKPLPGVGTDDLVIGDDNGNRLYVFDRSGRHLRTLNALTGATLYSFAYDGQGRLILIVDSDGNATTIERDGMGNPTAIIAPFGQRTELTVNADSYLETATDPAAQTHAMTYYAGGLLASFTNPRNQKTLFTYDDRGRLAREQNAAGGVQTLAEEILNSGNLRLVNFVDALEITTQYETEYLTSDDKRRTVFWPDGTKTTSLHETNGVIEQVERDGMVRTIVTSPDSRFGMQTPVQTSTVEKTPTLTRSMAASRTVSLANPSDLTSVTKQTDTFTINGRSSTQTYDAATRTTTEISAAGRKTQTTIDTVGRPTRTQTTGIEPVVYAYDARGHLETVTQGSGADVRTVTFAYDASGYLASITDALGRNAAFTYDPAGRVTRQTFPDGREVLFGYDTNGNLTSLTPPGRPAHAFTYTPVDLTATYVPPDVGAGTNSTDYNYNLDKQLTRITRPDGKTVALDYDTAGRLSTLTIPDGVFTYGYQAATGHLNQIIAPDGGTLSFSYDGSLLTGVTQTGSITGSVGFGYDNDFRVTSVTVNGANAMAYQYDADSLLIQAGGLTLNRSAQNGLLTGATLGSVSDSLSYDGFGEVTGYTAKYSGTTLLSTQFSYDKLGRITQKVETVQGDTNTYDYGYDLAGRLEKVKRNSVTTSVYRYDANGNRLSHTAGGTTVNGSYDNQDRLLSYGGNVYTYTANGELKTKTAGGQETTYRYDVLGNLKQVKLPDGRQIDYLVDAKNRRIGKKVDGTLVQGFLWQDQLKPIAELDGSGSLISRFVYATHVNVPDYMIRGGNTYQIITDHLGSPRLVVNIANGAIAQRLDYDEFGNVLTDTSPGFQPFGFAGGLYDRDTGLVRFGARDYDALVGRWTAKDPILFRSESSNVYLYSEADSVNFIDSFGYAFDLANLPQIPQWAVDLSAGFGDTVSLGLTDRIRDLWTDIGYGDTVDPCSGWYTNGKLMGHAWWATVIGAGSGPNGWLFGRWGNGILNNNPLFRIGWGWKGKSSAGEQIFRIAIGNKGWPFHLHFP